MCPPPPTLTIVDVGAPGAGAVDPDLRQLFALAPPSGVVLLVAYPSIESALLGARLGALAVLPPPLELPLLQALLDGEVAAAGDAPASGSADLAAWVHLQRVIKRCAGNLSRAARILKIDRRTLQRKLHQKDPPRE